MPRISAAQRELQAGIERLADPAQMEPVHLHVPNFSSVFSTLLQIESALGARFACDVDEEGDPLFAPHTDTLTAIENGYHSFAVSRPRELFADLQPNDKEVMRATYTVPLTVSGRLNKAIVSNFNYSPRNVRQEDKTTPRMLGRKMIGKPAEKLNPYHKPSRTSKIDPNARFYDRTTQVQEWNGTLGTV